MKKKMLGQVQTGIGVPPKVLRYGKQPSMLSIPPTVRQSRPLELWRERFSRARHKFMILLGPQYRELVRKLAFSMHKAGVPGMAVQLQLAIFSVWFFTGSVQKMEELIIALINRKVFLMNSPRLFLPPNTPAHLPKLQLAQRLLLYDPLCHPEGYTIDAASLPTLFVSFLGTPPADKPWIRQWISEQHEVRTQAAAEIGRETADALWAENNESNGISNADITSHHKSHKAPEKVSYW